jgi:hypothetical protein
LTAIRKETEGTGQRHSRHRYRLPADSLGIERVGRGEIHLTRKRGVGEVLGDELFADKRGHVDDRGA